MDNGEIGFVGYDTSTGEILEFGEIKAILEKERNDKIRGLFIKLKDNPYSLTTEEIKEVVRIGNSKSSKRLQLTNYERFDYFSTHNKELFDKATWDLSEEAFTCFCRLLRFSNSKNTLQFDNHRNIVMDDDFVKLLKISKRKWSTVKKILVEYGALRKIKFNKNTMYKINPSIIGHGMEIDSMTYYAFRDVLCKIFDPIKTLYWDKYLLESYGEDILCKSALDKKDFYSIYFNVEKVNL